MLQQSNLEVRPIGKGDPGLKQVQQLMEHTWSADSLIPEHLILTLLKNGGLILGAFRQTELIAFSFGFPGFDGKETYLCSHMLVVQQGLRHGGIGEWMKRQQRDFAINMGYNKMVWTYDPLESVNGYLNLTKLGAFCRTYLENCYGEMNDNINRGLPSDRFWVEWILDGEQASSSLHYEFDASQIAGHIEIQPTKLPKLVSIELDRQEAQLWIPVPKSTQAIKQANRELAKHWRYQFRDIVQHYFGRGYAATYLYRAQEGEVNYYLLEKGVY